MILYQDKQELIFQEQDRHSLTLVQLSCSIGALPLWRSRMLPLGHILSLSPLGGLAAIPQTPSGFRNFEIPKPIFRENRGTIEETLK